MPIPTKKWMVVLSDEQYNWIKDTSDKTDTTGAAVLRALVSQAMNENSVSFRRSLMSAQVQMELDELDRKKQAIADKEKELRAKLGTRERVTA